MSIAYENGLYDECFDWIKKRRNNGKSWEDLDTACKGSNEALCLFLQQQADNNDWPALSVSDWNDIINIAKKIEEASKSTIIPPPEIEPGDKAFYPPNSLDSAWVKYKNNLLKPVSEGGKGFSRASVENIESSSIDILNRLRLDNGHDYARKGLVVGNVQSGKTANMGALISMAADYGWNMFIILTGTIESLRQQTQRRFINDLQSGNITWMQINRFGVDATTKLVNFNLDDHARQRYLTCCLKQVSRLKRLQKFLNSDAKKKGQLKVLIIDDEADQAGLNTKDMSDPDFDRTAINKCICDIVNNTFNSEPLYTRYDEEGNVVGVKAKTDLPYKAMNYIAYTATPYGNFLNESGRESLYPRDFISILEPSDLYFGPQQIFGDTVRDMWDGMPIINEIPGDAKVGKTEATEDIEVLSEICDGDAVAIPNSLKQAIAWFCIATAIRRLQKSTNPCTMLVHHDFKIAHHNALGNAIKEWYKKITDTDLLSLCAEVYDEQTKQFSKEIFKDVCQQYGQLSGLVLDQDIKDYPLFDELIPYLRELHSEIAHIYLDDASNFKFRKGINICIDNCENRSLTEGAGSGEIPYVRLVYPEKGQYDGYAPAFIVIGGNTLSRGLTLEGLVCTYFSREVRQADTLMQMGRWFGYRKGYELLPRIWLTDMAYDKFVFLSELDTNLRTDLIKYKTLTTPMQCGPVIMNTPSVSFMRLTSANKSQGMQKAAMNFAGANMQTVNFINDTDILSSNLHIGEQFLNYLETSICKSNFKNGNRIWKNVNFDIVWEKFLKNYQGSLTSMENMDTFRQWVEALNAKQQLSSWNVVLSGPIKPNNYGDPTWQGVNKVTRTRKKQSPYHKKNAFSIGVLSDPSDWQADLDFTPIMNSLSSLQKDIVSGKAKTGNSEQARAAAEVQKMELRKLAGAENVPLMILYCVDHLSKAKPGSTTRNDLATDVDVLGIYVRIPGQKCNNDYCASVTIKLQED